MAGGPALDGGMNVSDYVVGTSYAIYRKDIDLNDPNSPPSPLTAMPVNLLNADATLGWRGLLPRAVLAGPGQCTVTVQTHALTPDFAVVQAMVHNPGQQAVGLRRIRWGMPSGVTPDAGLKFSKTWNPFYFSTENFRGDYVGPGTVRGYSYFNPMPSVTTELGWSEDHVFPGLFIGSAERDCGLLCAALTAQCFHLIFRLRGPNDAGDFFFEIDEMPTGADTLPIAPGATIAGERLFLQICKTGNPQHVTGQYYDLLRAGGVFQRRLENPLETQRIWCSWNYDFFDRITQSDVLKQLPVLTRHFPTVKFVQIDDGYQRTYAHGKRGYTDIIYDGKHPFDREKFPDGPAALTAAIKAAGLRPAIWMGLWAAMESPMIHDHPDWILLDETGSAIQFGDPTGFYGTVGVLDPSIPEVRDYVDRLCRTVFRDWGFEGVKLDFSSFAFECKRVRFKYPGQTALHWRRWLVQTFRKYLPADGFFGWCVVCGTGDPLLASDGADYFRCSEDIGNGDWTLVKRIATWCANTNMLMQQRPILPNMDSIGVSKNWTPTQWRTWLNLAAVTGAALELGGDLTALDPATLARLNATLELSKPARRVWCADIPTGSVAAPPSLWIGQGDGETILGLFNWSDDQRRLHVPAGLLEQLGVDRLLPHDPWNRQPAAWPRPDSPLELAPHESRLFRV